MWTDKKRFHLCSNDGRVWLRCSCGQARNNEGVRVVTSQGGRSITVWAGFTYVIKLPWSSKATWLLSSTALKICMTSSCLNFVLVDDSATSHRASRHSLHTGQQHPHWRLASMFSKSECDTAHLGYASEGCLCETTSSEQPGWALCCCPRRVEQLEPELAEVVDAQRSTQVPWGDSSKGGLHPLLTPRTPLDLTVCIWKWKTNGHS